MLKSNDKTRTQTKRYGRRQGCKACIQFYIASTAEMEVYVIRMPDKQVTKNFFYGKLQEGKCSECDQKERYKDTLKAAPKDLNLPIRSW